jgi:hypothetical protein
MRRTMVVEIMVTEIMVTETTVTENIEAGRAPAAAKASPAQNLWVRWQNQSPRTGTGRENPLQKMMLRPLADARNNNETDCDGSFTAATRTLRPHRESPFSFHRHRSAPAGAPELKWLPPCPIA